MFCWLVYRREYFSKFHLVKNLKALWLKIYPNENFTGSVGFRISLFSPTNTQVPSRYPMKSEVGHPLQVLFQWKESWRRPSRPPFQLVLSEEMSGGHRVACTPGQWWEYLRRRRKIQVLCLAFRKTCIQLASGSTCANKLEQIIAAL